MTLGGNGEPTLADVQAAYPHWVCRGPGTSEMFYALRAATGEHVHGEDPRDLGDQIKAAEARIDRAAGLADPPPWPKPVLTEDERALPPAD